MTLTNQSHDDGQVGSKVDPVLGTPISSHFGGKSPAILMEMDVSPWMETVDLKNWNGHGTL